MDDGRDNIRVIHPDAVALQNVTEPGVREMWPVEVREAIRQIWLTSGMRSATRSVREYARWLDDDAKVPSAAVVRQWVSRYEWASSAEPEVRAAIMQTTRAIVERAQPLMAELMLDRVAAALEPGASEFEIAAGMRAYEFGMRMFGWGSFGAQGGNMEQGSADGAQVERDLSGLSQEQRMQKLRDELAVDRHVAGS